MLGSLDASDQRTNRKPTPAGRVARKTIAVDHEPIVESTPAKKSTHPADEAFDSTARQTRTKKAIVTKKSRNSMNEVDGKQKDELRAPSKAVSLDKKHSSIDAEDDPSIVTDNSLKSLQPIKRHIIEARISTMKKESTKPHTFTTQKGKGSAERQPNGTGGMAPKNPPTAVVCSKLSFSSPDGSVLSELSFESRRTTYLQSDSTHPKFDRGGFNHDNAPLRPKAIFADEEFSAEGGDEFSTYDDDEDDDSQESTEDVEDSKSLKTTEREKSFNEGGLEGSACSASDESTQEQEFESDLEEEEPEEILEDGAADSDNFIVGSDEESDFEEDYESESDEDEDLVVDSDYEREQNKHVNKVEDAVYKKTRGKNNVTPADRIVHTNGTRAVQESGDVDDPIKLCNVAFHDAVQNESCLANTERTREYAYPLAQGSSQDENDGETFDSDSLPHGQSGEREGTTKNEESLRSESQKRKCPSTRYYQRERQPSPFVGSDTEDDESLPGAYAVTDNVDDEVEVIAQILTNTHMDEDLFDLIAEVVDDTSLQGHCPRDEDSKSNSSHLDTDESFVEGDESSLDDDEKTFSFDVNIDDAARVVESGGNLVSIGVAPSPDQSIVDNLPMTTGTINVDDHGDELLEQPAHGVRSTDAFFTEDKVALFVDSGLCMESNEAKELDGSSMPERGKEWKGPSFETNFDRQDHHNESTSLIDQEVVAEVFPCLTTGAPKKELASVPVEDQTSALGDRVIMDQELVTKGFPLFATDAAEKEEALFPVEDQTLTLAEKVTSHEENFTPDFCSGNHVIDDEMTPALCANADNVSTLDEDISSIMEGSTDDASSMRGTAASSPEVYCGIISDTNHHDSMPVVEMEIVKVESLIMRRKSSSVGPDKGEENDFNHENPDQKVQRKEVRREGSVRSGKWSLGSKIGTGSFGVVHVGLNTHTGQLMAVKSVELSPAAMKDVQVEVEVLKSLSHINIVRYLGAERVARTLHIFQEWVAGGSVTTLLNKFGPFSAAVIRSYLSQILTGLSFLHQNRILHRDIKGGNILISDDGIVKLADFGSAKRLAHQQSDMMESLTMRGTPYFMAPEVFEEYYNGKADIWSVGCVAFQMATGVPPWKTEGLNNPMSLFLHLRNSEGLPMLKWPESGPMRESEKLPFEEMLKRCFWRTATQRPTAQGLAADSFFSGASSSEDDASQARELFSPGGDSVSTFASKTPHIADMTPNAKRPPRSSFLSPPMPRRIGIISAVNVSPLDRSPKVDAKDWPSWARDQLKRESHSPMGPQDAKASPLMDSLAYSADTMNAIANPFARSSQDAGRECSPTLTGLEFIN